MHKDDSEQPKRSKEKTADHEDESELGFKVFDRRFWKLDEEELEKESDKRSQLPTYVESLKQQLDEKDQQLKEYIAAYKKEVVQGLEETKQRLERDANQRMKKLRGELSEPMLEVLDAFERSLSSFEGNIDPKAILQGIKMVHQLMLHKLKEIGLERIETVGKPFNPAVHEAIALSPTTDASQENLVVNEFTAGFMLDGRVIRPAKVQVARVQ